MKVHFRYLSAKERETVHRLSLQFLAEQGICFQDAKLSAKLCALGAKIKEDRLVFPEALTEALLAEMEKTKGKAAWQGTGNRGFTPLLVDDETGLYRQAKTEDVIRLCRVAESLTAVDFISLPQTEDQAASLKAALTQTQKPILTPCLDHTALLQMAANQGAFSCFFQRCGEAFEAELCLQIETAAKRKIPFGVCPEYRGQQHLKLSERLLLANIHNLAVLLTAKSLQRKSTVYYCGLPTVPGDCLEGIYLNSALGQMASFYGQTALLFCDGNQGQHSGTEACFENKLRCQSVQAMIPNALCQWLGSVDSGAALSLTDLVLDHEVHAMAMGYTREFSVDREHLGVKVIHEVGPGGHFLFHPHTLKHLSHEIWLGETKDSFIFNVENYKKEAKSRVSMDKKP